MVGSRVQFWIDQRCRDVFPFRRGEPLERTLSWWEMTYMGAEEETVGDQVLSLEVGSGKLVQVIQGIHTLGNFTCPNIILLKARL